MADTTQFRNYTTRYDPGMGLDLICDALNLGLYIGVDAPNGATPSISSAIIKFLQSGSGAIAETVQDELRKNFVSADSYAGASVTAQIDAAITASSDRVVIIPPTMGTGEPTSVGVRQGVIDLRQSAVGAGQKIIFNFADSVGHERFAVIDDQIDPTLSNAACIFLHRPSGTLPANASGEGIQATAATINSLSNSPSGYTLIGVEGTAEVYSTSNTIADIRGGTFSTATGASSTTNVTSMTSLHAQAPSKSGSGTIANACSIIAEDPGSIATTRNFAIWAKGAVQVDTTLSVTGLVTGNGGFYSLKTGGTAVELANSLNSSGIKSVEDSPNSNLAVFVNGTSNVVATFKPLAVSLLSANGITAGGTTGQGITVSSASNFGVFFGSGAPTLAAAKGSLYLRSDGSGAGDRAYINSDGSTTWTALTTAA